MERRLITAALPYINNVPHLGHIIGSHLPADIFARYCRLKGYETLFIGGTDENGSTSEIAAQKLGIEITKFCDTLHKEHKKVYDWFKISYDNFSRTSKPIHHQTTQEFFKQIYKNGYITKGKIKVFYSPTENRYLPDRYVKGTCPKCGYTEANADQCEKCTSVLNPEELINPRSAINNEKVEIREVEHLFLRLDKLSEKLKKWIQSKENWRSQVKNLALGWIKEGLKERCITRDLKHGVKVPLEGFEDKVFYVWFDAPIGYISSTKEATEKWEKFWKDKETKIYHFLGKDNIPFHTIFWPGMLIAHENFTLPHNVVGLQYLNYEGGKFSKSQKRGVFCETLIKTNISPDIIRAYLSMIIPETADSEFKWEEFQNRINADIIGNLSNFINRTLKFCSAKLNSKVSKKQDNTQFLQQLEEKIQKIENYFEKIELKNAFFEILSLSSFGNKYFNDQQPWVLLKENSEKAEQVIYNSLVLVHTLSILIQPFLPDTAEKIQKMLNLPKQNWKTLENKEFKETYEINPPEILFEKLTPEFIKSFKEQVAQGTNLEELFN